MVTLIIIVVVIFLLLEREDRRKRLNKQVRQWLERAHTAGPSGTTGQQTSRQNDPQQSAHRGPLLYPRYRSIQAKPEKAELTLLIGIPALIVGIILFWFFLFTSVLPGQGGASLIAPLLLILTGMVLYLIGSHNREVYRKCREMIHPTGNTLIDNIAIHIGRSYEDTLSILRAMLQKNYYPGAYIDYNNRLLVMTLENGQPIEPVVPYQGARCPQCGAPILSGVKFCNRCGASQQTAVAAKTTEGGIQSEREQYLGLVENLLSLASEPALRDPLFSLREISTLIYERLQKTPERAADFRKFHNIYMPAIKNAVETFERMKRARLEEDKVEESRRDAITAIEIGVTASKNFLDKLYQGDQLNVSMDIEVLRNMLLQDGLLRDKEKMVL